MLLRTSQLISYLCTDSPQDREMMCCSISHPKRYGLHTWSYLVTNIVNGLWRDPFSVSHPGTSTAWRNHHLHESCESLEVVFGELHPGFASPSALGVHCQEANVSDRALAAFSCRIPAIELCRRRSAGGAEIWEGREKSLFF